VNIGLSSAEKLGHAADPRVQQVAHFVRERMREPLVRSGVIPGLDYTTMLGPARTDLERLTAGLRILSQPANLAGNPLSERFGAWKK
jgi:hypothetical protein